MLKKPTTACKEIVLPVATAYIMAPHVVPKQKSKQKHPLAITNTLGAYLSFTNGVSEANVVK